VDFVLLAAAEDGPRPFPEPVVAALRRVVACETVAYREWEKHGIRDRSFAPESLDERRAIWDEYPRFRCEDPNPSEMPSGGASTVASARQRTGEPLLLSEAVSRRWFRCAGLYFELMRPFGIRDVLKLFLPRHGGRESSQRLSSTRALGGSQTATARPSRSWHPYSRNSSETRTYGASWRSRAGGCAD